MAGNTISKIKINNVNNYIASSAYGVCSSAANANKIVNLQDNSLLGFQLTSGTTVHIKFINTNTKTNPTLNINNTGAIPIKKYGNTSIGVTLATSWIAGSVISLTYDGTNFILNDYLEIPNNGTIPSAGTSATSITSGSSSGGSTNTWSKSDHVHNITLTTGDNNGQVKIAGTNVAVKGLAAAAYANFASSINNNDTNQTTVTNPKSVSDFVNAKIEDLASTIPEASAPAFTTIKKDNNSFDASSNNSILTFIPGNNIDINLDYQTKSISIGSSLESYSAQENGTDLSLVTTGDKYRWNNTVGAVEVYPGTSTVPNSQINSAMIIRATTAEISGLGIDVVYDHGDLQFN